MRGGRNKFGPMYKYDRALKQQALRHHRAHFVDPTTVFSAALGGVGTVHRFDSLDSEEGGVTSPRDPSTLEDIKPDISLLAVLPYINSGCVGDLGAPPPRLGCGTNLFYIDCYDCTHSLALHL